MLLPDSNQLKLGTVSGYKRESEGFLLGSTTPNPLLNSRMYQVTFTDGNICDFAANAIAEAIYSQHDDEGNKYTLIKERMLLQKIKCGLRHILAIRVWSKLLKDGSSV